MAVRRVVAAVDLGAESGRVVLGRYDGRRVALREVHRFGNRPRQADGLLRWDFGEMWRQVTDGLALAAAGLEPGERIDAVGVDTWGVDYGLLDRDGRLLDDPVSYRDPRTRGMVARAAARVGRERLYRTSGIQLLEINTIYQLLADDPARLARADRLLLMPDLFHHRLSGRAVTEYTNATTTGAYQVPGGGWATGLLDDLGVPTGLLPEVVDPGTDVGPVLPGVLDGEAFRDTRVVAPGSHDTASAVVGVPLADSAAAYVSSGTWSLVGVETPAPVVTEAARRANLTNEGGVAGTVRLLRNCMGLWLLQECRRHWRNRYGYDDLVAMADGAPAGRSVVNPDHPDFVTPGDMPSRIRDYCARTGQPVPSDVAAVARCVLDSLALRYRNGFDDLAAVTGRPVTGVHVVGGGSRNHLLNQLTADVSGLPVSAGPVEATALGNVLVQLSALGELDGLAQMRAVVRASEPTSLVEPRDPGRYDDLYGSFTERVAADLTVAGAAD